MRGWPVAPDGGVTHYTHDGNGDVLSITDPTGAQIRATYDVAGRTRTTTKVVRQPSPAAYTTTYSYEKISPAQTAGVPALIRVTSPTGVQTTSSYDALGDVLTTTDGAGSETGYTYDAAGRRIATVLPDGSGQTAQYDLAGRMVSASQLDASGAVLSTVSQTYDAAGQVIGTTDPRGQTSTFSYDATGLTATETQPVSTGTSINTSFGYDATGNPTRFTDGRGNAFRTTYTPWNQPESQVEPATARYPDLSDRTFTTSYDAAGRPVNRTAPGGVSLTNSYDTVGNLTEQAGAGAAATTTTRTFAHDLDGRLTSVSAGAGTDTFTYDDRGLLLTATGPSGASSFGYAGDGQLTSRTDAAGTSSYTYDTAGRVNQVDDALTGEQLTLGYNTMSQVAQVHYGSSGDTRTFGYDAAHRLASDTLTSPTGDPVASISYGYDVAGNETSKTTTGLVGAASNTYTYDDANRLTSWNDGTHLTSYGYDASGNRTSAGGVSYTYDARNQLISGGGNTYGYTARGTLSSVTSGSGTISSTSDAFDQTITSGDRTYAYDGLGRLLQASTGSSHVDLSYSGMSNDVVSDGANLYGRGPGENVLSVSSGGPARLAWTDQHADMVGQFTASGTSVSGSASYDPLGAVLGSTGLIGNLGFQSGWTDPGNGKVNMASRWYDPSVGQFTTRDSVGLSPMPASVGANRFAYVDDNPLTSTDPTGHCGFFDCVSAGWHAVTSTASKVWNGVTSVAAAGWNYISDAASNAWNYVQTQAEHVYDTAVDIGRTIVNDTKHLATTVVNQVKDVVHVVEHKVVQAVEHVSHAVQQVAVAASHVATQAWDATTHAVSVAGDWVQAHEKQIAAGVAGFVVGVGTFAGCMVVTGGVGSLGCAALAGAAGGAVAGLIGCPAGVSKLACAGIGAASGLVAVGAGALAAAGAAALGAGGLVGGILAGGAAGAAGDITSQLLTTGHVSWSEVGMSALIGGALGGLGGAFGGARGRGAAGDTAAGDTAAESVAADTGAADAAEAESAAPRSTAEADQPRGGTGQDEPSPVNDACAVVHSFAPATPVKMADGGTKPIKDVKVGDAVAATDPETGATTAQPVTATWYHDDDDMTDLTVAITGATTGGKAGTSGTHSEVIHTTQHHPFWDSTKGSWVAAADLSAGDQLASTDGTVVTVASVVSYPAVHAMFDLTVARTHTFYVVAGSTPVLVHNCGSQTSGRACACSNSSQGPGNAYSVAYETQLSPRSYPGLSRGAHFRESNQNLLDAMNADSAFDDAMESIIPGIRNRIQGPGGGAVDESPTDLGWTWHHHVDPGRMQLVPVGQHTGAAPFSGLFHPGGRGGFAMWG